MTPISIHLFLNEYGLTLAVFLVAVVCICCLFLLVTDYEKRDRLEAERKYANGEL